MASRLRAHRPFADLDQHPQLRLGQRLGRRRRFVIGTDPRGRVGLPGTAREPGRVTIDRPP